MERKSWTPLPGKERSRVHRNTAWIVRYLRQEQYWSWRQPPEPTVVVLQPTLTRYAYLAGVLIYLVWKKARRTARRIPRVLWKKGRAFWQRHIFLGSGT